jgi:tetratricopeptide (TPR) repeat protein
MGRFTTLLCALAAVSLLAACATAPGPKPDALFDDAAFRPPSVPTDAAGVFAISAPMQQYLDTEIRREVNWRSSPAGLIDALYTRGRLQLEYDSTRTRNAAEAFDARAGNCLSLVLMTAAFAKEMHLSITYRTADREEIWGPAGDLLVRSGHVNITIGAIVAGNWTDRMSPSMTVDFLPQRNLASLRTREISEQTVVAMYMNNRAVESLLDGSIDDAYSWTRAAILADPTFTSSYVTLGVVYLRHGDLARAETALNRVLERAPRNTSALSNLAEVLDREGRGAAADVVRSRLTALEPIPPFFFYRQGVAAMARGDYRAARDLFAREIKRADYDYELHYWLALADFRLGELGPARREMEQARENSPTGRARDLYAAKLAWLQAQTHP